MRFDHVSSAYWLNYNTSAIALYCLTPHGQHTFIDTQAVSPHRYDAFRSLALPDAAKPHRPHYLCVEGEGADPKVGWHAGLSTPETRIRIYL